MQSEQASLKENFSFWKNLFLTVVFFTLTPVTIGVSLFSLLSLSTANLPDSSQNFQKLNLSGARIYASLPSTFSSVSGSVTPADARVELIRQYLARYNSRLEPLSSLIVQTADKYGIDYRLIVAIAQQESNLCKIIPPNSNNCWGWGIHSKGTLGFASLEEGIEIVSKGIKEEYINKGYLTVQQIMKKYTPLSNGSWAAGVTQFMSEME